jgi:hypothetical protein
MGKDREVKESAALTGASEREAKDAGHVMRDDCGRDNMANGTEFSDSDRSDSKSAHDSGGFLGKLFGR